MKKRILTLCLVLVLASACLAGCAAEETEQISTETEEYLTESAEVVFETYFLSRTDVDEIDEAYEEFTDDGNELMANAMLAWKQLQDELGAYVGVDSCEVSLSDDGYSVDMIITFEERDMTFHLLSNKRMTEWTAISLEGVYSLGERMQKGLINTVIGMCTVFAVLLIITFVIYLFGVFGKLFQKTPGKKEKEEQAPKEIPEESEEEGAVPEAAAEEVPEEESDDLALVAVIAAAIAASENTSPDGLVVRSIRRKPNNWKHA